MSWWKSIKESITDISSLEVLTFTGEVSAVIAEKTTTENGNEVTTNLIDWENMISLSKPGGQVELVGATKIEIDKDVRQFIAKGAPQFLIDLHQETVESSQAARQGMVNMVVEGVKNI